MKFKLKVIDAGSEMVLKFEADRLQDIIMQLNHFLQGAGFVFGEKELKLIPWKEDQ